MNRACWAVPLTKAAREALDADAVLAEFPCRRSWSFATATRCHARSRGGTSIGATQTPARAAGAGNLPNAMCTRKPRRPHQVGESVVGLRLTWRPRRPPWSPLLNLSHVNLSHEVRLLSWRRFTTQSQSEVFDGSRAIGS